MTHAASKAPSTVVAPPATNETFGITLRILSTIAFALMGLCLGLALIALLAITQIFLKVSTGNLDNLASLSGLAGALLGAPLLIWRAWVLDKNARIQDESLLNDKFNAAAEDLAARRQVTRSVMHGDNEVILTE